MIFNYTTLVIDKDRNPILENNSDLENFEVESKYLLIKSDWDVILENIRKKGARRIKLITFGSELADVNTLKKMIQSGINHFQIVYPAHNEHLYRKFIEIDNWHFLKAEKGLQNLFSINKTNSLFLITFEVPIFNGNYNDISSIVKYLIQKSYRSFAPKRFHLKLKCENLSYSSISPEIEKCLDICMAENLWLTISGFPFCVLKDAIYHCEEIYKFSKVTDNKGILSCCNNCRLVGICRGISNEYLQKFGRDEIKPILDDNLIKSIKDYQNA